MIARRAKIQIKTRSTVCSKSPHVSNSMAFGFGMHWSFFENMQHTGCLSV